MDDVIVYAQGIFRASVCSSLPARETVRRANELAPAGTDHGWQLSADATFKGGEPNPCPCDKYPNDRKHYLLDC